MIKWTNEWVNDWLTTIITRPVSQSSKEKKKNWIPFLEVEQIHHHFQRSLNMLQTLQQNKKGLSSDLHIQSIWSWLSFKQPDTHIKSLLCNITPLVRNNQPKRNRNAYNPVYSLVTQSFSHFFFLSIHSYGPNFFCLFLLL